MWGLQRATELAVDFRRLVNEVRDFLGAAVEMGPERLAE
jgi:hypothetical protein